MKKKILTTVVTIMASSLSFAGTFDGPYIQAAFGVVNKQIKAQQSGTDSGSWSEGWNSVSSSNAAGQVALGYSYNPLSLFNIAANLYYDISSQDGGQYATSQPYTMTPKLKNVWGISIEPGAYLANKTLGYVKLGWTNGTTSVRVTDDGSQTGNMRKNVNGFLYGIGIKRLLTDNIFIGVEFSQSQFNQASSTYPSLAGGNFTETIHAKPTQTMGLITLGYKF